jgi:hypothetical protein
VDAHPLPVDDGRSVHRPIPRAPLQLWEPGDDTGTMVRPVTCDDTSSSTIHNPYYHHWLD